MWWEFINTSTTSGKCCHCSRNFPPFASTFLALLWAVLYITTSGKRLIKFNYCKDWSLVTIGYFFAICLVWESLIEYRLFRWSSFFSTNKIVACGENPHDAQWTISWSCQEKLKIEVMCFNDSDVIRIRLD